MVGSGPNGLAAAIRMVQGGRSTLLIEAQGTIGGAARSFPFTLPGFVHDFGAAILPLGVASPFFRTLPLCEHGLEWVHPPASLAHPLDDGSVAMIYDSLEATAASLSSDADAYLRLMEPLALHWEELTLDLLAPLRPPCHPLLLARFGLRGLRSARGLASSLFRGQQARALIAGLGAHSILPLERPPSAAFALTLAMLAHGCGWPFPRGGTQSFTNALTSYFRSLGGEIITGVTVRSLDDLPPAGAVLCDVTPRQLLSIAGDRLPRSYSWQLNRYRYGPGVFKLDYALNGPIPWKITECARAGTVHLGGGMEEIAAGERAVWRGETPEKPFVLLAQQSLFDPSRAPAGKHTAWAYCHVPNGCTFDMTQRIESQIERFAPGFRDLVLTRHAMGPSQLEQRDANLVGGDINGGLQDLWQQYTRPALRLNPYSTPVPGLFICSSSTPPGGGVHGMCGYFAAERALRRTGRPHSWRAAGRPSGSRG
ncbi:MAG: phytoene desaturase family protein [Chloroflexota bacterium]